MMKLEREKYPHRFKEDNFYDIPPKKTVFPEKKKFYPILPIQTRNSRFFFYSLHKSLLQIPPHFLYIHLQETSPVVNKQSGNGLDASNDPKLMREYSVRAAGTHFNNPGRNVGPRVGVLLWVCDCNIRAGVPHTVAEGFDWHKWKGHLASVED